MNKEEVLNAFLLANIPEIITQEEFDDVKKSIRELQQENQKYKEIIDKVSTRLEYFLISNSKYQSSQEEFIKLLNILKEEE